MRPREVRAALGISEATLHRYVRKGILPAPQYVAGIRDFPETAIVDLRERRLRAPRREVPPALPEGRRIRDEAQELRGAAAEALVHAGVVPVRDALQPWSRLADVPVPQRRRLTSALRKLTAIARERDGGAANERNDHEHERRTTHEEQRH